ncbi:hypothetical protein [Mycolicibacterium sp. XJ1819]
MVLSLTALTGGITPALAQPDDEPVAPSTTIVAPKPEPKAPERQEGRQDKAPEPKAPEPKAPAPQTQAPQPQTQAPQPQTQAPQPQTQEPAPQTQAPASQAPALRPEPQTQAPQTQAPQTQAPSTATKPPVTSVEPAEPTQEPTTAQRAPATSSAPAETSSAPRTSNAPAADADDAGSDDAETSATPTAPSAALAPGSPESENGRTPEPSARETAPSESASETPAEDSETSESNSDESETPTVSLTQAAKEIETVEPQKLEAPVEDVQLARAAEPIVIEEQPEPATEEDVAAFSNAIETTLKVPGLDIGAQAKTEINLERRRDVELVSNVRQWRSDWIEYDEYYRPIVLNPFRAPVRIVYVYDMRPRFVIIPPLARMVIEAAQFAAYSFTAAVLAPINAAIDTAQALTNIAVGSFFGGGYYPGFGRPLPPPPPPVLRYDNVPVFVNYSNARYEPFRVRQIVDVGEDPRFGERKVLLDGATPAWGVWTQTPTGERQFEVHRTQQFPGLDAPAEAPLPGDYQLRLLADDSSDAGFTSRDIFLFVTAGVIGTLGFGAIAMAFYLGRRRPEH